ncbi:ATP-binding protein [Pseudomonas aeruginosa]|nr:ATP-binding protein [Pseudomonas aeruginosa]OPE35476.1 ATP-binding protein [Pseudomonas aeruginosa]PAZ18834.1 ATP-binding protein [Pseudomonas aeruginosa]RPX33992.1 ATP-binding protein [Pseudomonas aeruginosa]RRY03058.1 ATP-binding protein [Pseudomonas aeruginosa]
MVGGENGWHAALARRLGFRRLAPGTQRGDACPGRQRDDIDVYIRAT